VRKPACQCPPPCDARLALRGHRRQPAPDERHPQQAGHRGRCNCRTDCKQTRHACADLAARRCGRETGPSRCRARILSSAVRHHPGGDLRPRAEAQLAADLPTWLSAVRSEIKSRAAISRLVSPWATRSATSRSRRVRFGVAKCSPRSNRQRSVSGPGWRIEKPVSKPVPTSVLLGMRVARDAA